MLPHPTPTPRPLMDVCAVCFRVKCWRCFLSVDPGWKWEEPVFSWRSPCFMGGGAAHGDSEARFTRQSLSYCCGRPHQTDGTIIRTNGFVCLDSWLSLLFLLCLLPPPPVSSFHLPPSPPSSVSCFLLLPFLLCLLPPVSASSSSKPLHWTVDADAVRLLPLFLFLSDAISDYIVITDVLGVCSRGATASTVRSASSPGLGMPHAQT